MHSISYSLLSISGDSQGGGILPSFTSVLLHFANFLILALVLFYFIYKPVKKGMTKRQAEAKKTIEENAALSQEVQKMKEESLAMSEKSREESIKLHQQVLESAGRSSEDIVNKAHEQAKLIIEEAKKESEHIKNSLNEDIRAQIAQVSVSVAQSILNREITPDDNDAFIEKCLQSWDKND